jgi:hypothetical protein
MRPDKPGHWWYKTSYGPEKIAYIASGFSFELCVIDNQHPVCISVFECSSEFGEWLAQAHPPKKIGNRVNEARVLNTDDGLVIPYEDVKEFLLNGDYNEE